MGTPTVSLRTSGMRRCLAAAIALAALGVLGCARTVDTDKGNELTSSAQAPKTAESASPRDVDPLTLDNHPGVFLRQQVLETTDTEWGSRASTKCASPRSSNPPGTKALPADRSKVASAAGRQPQPCPRVAAPDRPR